MKSFAATMLVSLATAELITLATFDGAKGTTFDFIECNDPVMGGESYGTFEVKEGETWGTFQGEVVLIPALQAPGFIKTAGDGVYVDASDALNGTVVLSVRSTTPEYEGFRVTLVSATSPSYSCSGGGSIPFSRGCFKAKFNIKEGSEFSEVRIPMSEFSDMWSPATGEHTEDCADDDKNCIRERTLKHINRVEVWAEGAAGKVHVDIQSISVETADSFQAAEESETGTQPPKEYDQCTGPAQSNLKYGIAGRTESWGLADANENLVESVCCDSRNEGLAEPQFSFEAPDIRLFSRLNKNEQTTFYDSICGIPLFTAPIGRTFEEWEAESKEHGWPSFREAEMHAENFTVDPATGIVTSKCGMHMGTELKDDDKGGKRYCMDLSCLAGRPNTMNQIFLQ